MSTQAKCLLLALVVAFAYAEEFPQLYPGKSKDPTTEIYGQVTAKMLLEPFMEKDAKTLFKAWHFVFNKQYDYNTEDGLKKYQTFKVNLKEMKEHNSKGLSWSQGLNHLSDMTEAEIYEYYNISSSNFQKAVNNLRTFPNDIASLKPALKRGSCDHKSKMQEVRNQGNCGSCWAFATHGILEGSYNLRYGGLNQYFSTQQLVDCDTKNNGCNGGFYFASLNYYKTNTIVYEKAYPYRASRGSCTYVKGMTGDTGVKISGYSYYMKGSSQSLDFDTIMQNGPMGVGVGVNNAFFRYSSGVLDTTCASNNHAVVVVGYACESADNCGNKAGCYFVIRNSWGPNWGENGYLRVKDNGTTKSSCGVEEVGFGVTGFTR